MHINASQLTKQGAGVLLLTATAILFTKLATNSCSAGKDSGISNQPTVPEKPSMPAVQQDIDHSSNIQASSDFTNGFNEDGIDGAGHSRSYYRSASHKISHSRVIAYGYIDEGRYREAASYLRPAFENAVEDVIAHHFGNAMLTNACRTNIQICRNIFDEKLIERMHRTYSMLSSISHQAAGYEDQNMSKERIMAAYNTISMLENKIRSYGNEDMQS